MSRTREQIAAGIAEGIVDTNEGMRVDYGPVRDSVIDPVAGGMAPYEAAAEALALLSSTMIIDDATPDMALALASRHGVGRSIGTYAYGTQVFYRNTKPSMGTSYAPPVGQIVRRKDGRLYQVKNHSVALTADNAAASYVASRRRYELPVPIQALAVGPEYDAAPGTVTELDGVVPGFDGTTNLEWISNGRAAKTAAATVEEARLAMLGSAEGTHGGVFRRVTLSGIRVEDLVVVRHSEPVFQRTRTGRPLLDVHVIGEESAEHTYTVIATAGQTDIVLSRQPVLAVARVLRNGGAVSFTLRRDTTRSTSYSAWATDSVIVAACADGDVISVEYTYNAVVYELQKQLFTEDTDAPLTSLFGVSSLVRGPVRVPIEVHVSVSLGQQRRSAGLDAARSSIRSVCIPGSMGVTIRPEAVEQAAKSAVYGSTEITIRSLRRLDMGSSDVGIIELQRSEVAYFASVSDLEVSDV